MKEAANDTRGSLMCLLDWEQLHDEKKSRQDVVDLIKMLPSLSLLNIVSTINRNLYLQDSGQVGQQTQNDILKGLLQWKSPLTIRIIEAFSERIKEGQYVAFFYRYSNLLFYEILLENYNDQPIRDLTPTETEQFIKAYFIVNGLVNERIQIPVGEIEQAFDDDRIEDVILPYFIYQRDFTSNTDYSNQVTRGYYFFKYLDEHPIFSQYINQYYGRIGVTNRSELLFKFISAFSPLLKAGKTIITLTGDLKDSHNRFLVTMSIDPKTFVSKNDYSFSHFRNQMFLCLPNGKLMLLDICFFIDQLYKAHVFAFNALMKENNINDFLSLKGKEFMEQIYLSIIMSRCFPHAMCLPGKTLLNNKGNELADYLVQKDGKLLLVEFKDILLSAGAKNSGCRNELFKSLDEKLLKNERGKPKGIKQLIEGISELTSNYKVYATHLAGDLNSIYPVLIYTDNVFGYDGVNKKYRMEFEKLLKELPTKRYLVREVVFINLSFFELHEDLLKTGQLEIFDLIDDYLQHVADPNTSIVSFEVFATSYRRNTVKGHWGPTSLYKETTDQIKKEFLSLP